MNDVVIRGAKQGEHAAIGELTAAAYIASGYLDERDRYAAELRAAADRAQHTELLVATDHSEALLGSVTVVEAGTKYAEMSRDGELEFRMLAVAERARGRGVGQALTEAVLRRGRELGSSRVVLCSMNLMRPAHRLYERLGFTRIPERDWRPEPDVDLLAYGYELNAWDT